MADDGSEKKPKTVSIKDTDDMHPRVPQLESEVQRLRSEIEQLRGRIRQLEGNHEVLPVVVVPATVDLSRVDTSIVAHVASFLGESPELLNLALTCKSFGWRQPSSTLNLSLVEEVASRAARSRATDAEMSSLPAYTSGTATWLLHIPAARRRGCQSSIDLSIFLISTTAVCTIGSDEWGDDDVNDFDYGDYCTAVSSGYVMTSGVHCVEFNTTALPCCIGIVRPMPGLDADRFDWDFDDFFSGMRRMNLDFLAQRSDDWGGSNIHACEYNTLDFTLKWTNWSEEEGSKEGERGCIHPGSDMGSISIVLNLDEGTIAVYDCTYSVHHKVLLKDDGLSGPYCWYVKLSKFATISMKRGTSQTEVM
ncbi:hypothetical protein THAOC_22433 [Thalassiosira oceanica]|uniref:Uncharacterized protein n=1 Tax=Thalassiosira oceanica TaxID=159749 RepID=K0RYF5_THAOC|nr:hypothetical protein THAOC_22433 [Thalassiosira oceanica]|eukprot:EJK57514.1 hypothetical protein THAOC_22433 [Thalassiosira oceanica]